MANRYSKANTQKEKKEEKKTEFSKYQEKQRRLNTAARVMAIVVSLAMIVTAFLSAGVFFLK